MSKLIAVSILLIALLAGCVGVDKDVDVTINDFSSWDDQQVYSFLREVFDHTQTANTMSFKTKAEIVTYYEEYFSKTLSEEIANSLFQENSNGDGWSVVQGSDGGFFVYEDDEYNEITITNNKDAINFMAKYEIGLWSSVEYVIENPDHPIITQWINK
ncbi:MAG: IseA DL-endopeptidase inhibitor family protein [Dethiosulfatibacter sp.]|nr:IseA DL-endopeptidase inhibitor family protein [Dethiosulfatibacter sp.]